MTMTKKETCLIALLLVLSCTSCSWMGMVSAEDGSGDGSDEEMSMTLSEVVDVLLPLGQSCDPVPKREEVEEVVLNKETASHESKCFRRCMLMQFDVMPEGEKKYDGNKTVEMMNMMFAKKEAETRIITDKCNQPSDITDECEIAHSIAMCMLREMRLANYNIPDIKE